jgi:uncharacterized repeat protein (TIGR02543 family)
MSKWFSLILCVVLFLVLSACGGGSTGSTKTTSAVNGVSFSFSKDALVSAKSARVLSATTTGTLDPAAKYALISATDANGNPALTDKKTDIYTLSGSYVTATIPLPPGNYTITKFWVLDSNNNILYLIPTQSASDDIKKLITKLLPIDFSVAADTNNTLALQVLAPDNSTSQEFGYPSFSFNIVNYVKLMSCVQTQVGENWPLISADLTVNGVYYSHPALTTTLRVAQADSYTLKFSKSGYLSKTITLGAAEIASYQSTPLVVVLTSAPSYTVAFNSNGGTAVSSQNVVTGGLVGRPVDPIKSGCSFAGWYADQSLTGPQFDFNTPVNSNLTLYAKWTLVTPGASVTLHGNGVYTAVGSTAGLTITVPTGHDTGTTPSYNVTLPALAKNVVVSCYGAGAGGPYSDYANGQAVQGSTLTGILGVPLDLFVGQGGWAGASWPDMMAEFGGSTSIYLHNGTVLKMMAGGGGINGGSDGAGPNTLGPYRSNTLGALGGTVTDDGGGNAGSGGSGQPGWITISYEL